MTDIERKTATLRTRLLALLASLAIVTISLAVARIAWDDGVGSPIPVTEAARAQSALGIFVPAPQPAAVPDISFEDGTGAPVSLARFRGQVVLLNFWATWCAPCVEEMPSLNRLSSRFAADGLAVVALSQDRGGMKIVQPFFAEHKLDALPIYLDKTMVSGGAFKLRGLPTTILIDRDGRELGRFEGAVDWDSAPVQEVLRRALTPADKPTKT